MTRHPQARSVGSCLFLPEAPRRLVFLPHLLCISQKVTRLLATNKPPIPLHLSLQLLPQPDEPPFLPGVLPLLGISRLLATNKPPDPLQLSLRLLQLSFFPLPGVLPPLKLSLWPLPGPVFAQRQVALPR